MEKLSADIQDGRRRGAGAEAAQSASGGEGIKGGWGLYLLGKALRLILLLAAVSAVTFTLVSHSPVDPVRAYIGADILRVGPEQQAQIAAYWGLDEPPLERFFRWVGALLSGDLGTSMIYREPVADVIAERFASSALLMAAAWLLSGALGFSAGIAAAMAHGRWPDRLIRRCCYLLASTPPFWLALLLLTVFGVALGWFPIGLAAPAGMAAEEVGWLDRLRHMALPALTLSVVGIAPVALHTRQKLLEVLASDHALYARSRGERGWALLRRHGLRAVALPALSLQLAGFSELFGGAVLAEQVFSYPGLGQATVQAGLRGDVPLLMGLVLGSALFVFAGNLLADLSYRLVDPRLRERSRTS
ncbi:ABC transporter permease [Paenibacillus pasadenensis]|uniref:Dipeptide transport system permease protein DppB n=1 Tax=Paenibacillus pasadenensis TaxID=217090 RepID=A0A2N5N7D6_9BACL|nr:ABC transporter permease [Paenibacillus pasadenensis]PLT46248.1 Dipeptide transport system permease protein DppB [Paenibacillus pasadenensis]